MPKTRQKILNKALELFNDKGISSVSSKLISEELDISYGNLCYHFPRKDDIILQLYMDMQERIDERFLSLNDRIFNFKSMMDLLRALFEEMYRYRFVYSGITKVMSHFDHIKKHAQQQNKSRGQVLHTIGSVMIQKGYLRPFKSEVEKDMMIHTLLIFSNSWISDAGTFYEGKEEDKISYYLQLFYNLVRPQLTERGLEVYRSEVFESFESAL